MNNSSSISRYVTAEPNIAPPLERWNRGEVYRDGKTVNDSEGGIGDPYRVLTTLRQMANKGTITTDMWNAGEFFHAMFVVGQLHAIRAADMGRIPVEGMRVSQTPGRIMRARQWVWEALCAMGGIASPCGRVAWHILGEEMPIDHFARSAGWSGRPLKRETASGLLIGALGVLVAMPAPEPA